MMAQGNRAHADRRPNAPQYRLQAEAMFVRREGLEGNAGVALGVFRDDLCELFFF